MSRLIASITRLISSGDLSSNDLLLRHQILKLGLGDRYHANYTRMHHYNTRARYFSAYGSVQPSAPLPPQPPSSSLTWLLGIVLTITLPFVGNKYGPLLQFKNDVDTAVETMEEIVKVVEKAAEVVEKVAEELSGDLPAGGKFKKVVDIVENVAEQTAEDAHTVENAIDKFQELEDKIENIVGTLKDEGNKHPKDDVSDQK